MGGNAPFSPLKTHLAPSQNTLVGTTAFQPFGENGALRSHLCFSYVIIYGELSAILLLEPKAIDGVNKGEVLLFFLYDILVLKGLLVLGNRVRVAQVIDLLHGLRREMLLTIGYRLEHLYLCGAATPYHSET